MTHLFRFVDKMIQPLIAGRSLNSLQLTLLLSVALPLVLLSALATRFIFAELNVSREEALKGDLALIARAIHGPVSDALNRDSSQGLEAILDSVFSLGRIYGASVYDSEGRPIAAAGAAESDMSGSRITRRLFTSSETQEDYREIDGEDVFSHFLPLFNEHGNVNGFIQLNRRESDFQAALKQLTWVVWAGWIAVALSITAVVLMGHYRSVGRHLRTLVGGLPKIASGDFATRFAVQGPSEVRDVTRSLNSMLQSLEQRERELAAQRREEQSLQHRLSNAERLATVGRLTRGFAHELGAPLSVIKGRARRIARDSPESHPNLESLQLQVQRVERLVQDLLDYSGGSNPDAFTCSQPLVVAEEALTTLQQEHDDGDPDFHLIVDPAANVQILADKRRLELALLNILRNARQAAYSRIELVVTVDQAQLVFEVRDDGPGLAELPAVLMQPFWSSKPSGEGSGLGLPISAAIVQEHGGSMALKNDEKGAVVILRLPIHDTNSGDRT